MYVYFDISFFVKKNEHSVTSLLYDYNIMVVCGLSLHTFLYYNDLWIYWKHSDIICSEVRIIIESIFVNVFYT